VDFLRIALTLSDDWFSNLFFLKLPGENPHKGDGMSMSSPRLYSRLAGLICSLFAV
jgi:hypothetical protein